MKYKLNARDDMRIKDDLDRLGEREQKLIVCKYVIPYLRKLSRSMQFNFKRSRSRMEAFDVSTFRLVHEKLMGKPPSPCEEGEFLKVYNDFNCQKAVDFVIHQQNAIRAKTKIQRVFFHVSKFPRKADCVRWMKAENEKRKYGGKNETYPSFYKWQLVYPEKGNGVPEKFYDPPDTEGERYHKFMQFYPNEGKRYRMSPEIDDGVYFLYEF